MIKYALRCLKQFSLCLQSIDANIVDVTGYLDDLKEKLVALKNENGKTRRKFMLSFETDGRYKSVAIVKKNADDNNFQGVRGQFFQSLCDNVVQRFPSSELMKAASCLSQIKWPTDPLKRALFGEAKIAMLRKSFEINNSEADTVTQHSITTRKKLSCQYINVRFKNRTCSYRDSQVFY
jgi:hypothetical protein